MHYLLLIPIILSATQALAAEKISISYIYADAYRLTPDIDESENNQGIEIDFNLADTSGRGWHFSINDPNKVDFIGFTYLAADHYDSDRMGYASTDLGMLEFGLKSYREYYSTAEFYLGASLNLGWYRIKLPDLGTQSNPAAGSTVFIESLLDKWLKLRFSGSMFSSGRPGETITNASYFSLGIGVEL